MTQLFPVFTYAQQYRDSGLSVAPVLLDGSKGFNIKWGEYQTRLPNDAELLKWFTPSKPARYGIAIVCGAVSGNTEVIDIDVRSVFPEYKELLKQYGALDIFNRCAVVETGGGGAHIYYRVDPSCPVGSSKKLAHKLLVIPDDTPIIERKNKRYVKVEGKEYEVVSTDKGDRYKKCSIETRAEGSCAIAPGSPASVHPSGNEYRLRRGDLCSLPVLTADERDLMIGLALSLEEYHEEYKPIGATTPRKERTKTDEGLLPGEDYNERVTPEEIIELLEEEDWKAVRRGSGYNLTRPGKKFGFSASFSPHQGKWFFRNFSSNAPDFETDKSYSPFYVYAILKHGGDFSEAAKELHRQGYGKSSRPRTFQDDAPPPPVEPPATFEEWKKLGDSLYYHFLKMSARLKWSIGLWYAQSDFEHGDKEAYIKERWGKTWTQVKQWASYATAWDFCPEPPPYSWDMIRRLAPRSGVEREQVIYLHEEKKKSTGRGLTETDLDNLLGKQSKREPKGWMILVREKVSDEKLPISILKGVRETESPTAYLHEMEKFSNYLIAKSKGGVHVSQAAEAYTDEMDYTGDAPAYNNEDAPEDDEFLPEVEETANIEIVNINTIPRTFEISPESAELSFENTGKDSRPRTFQDDVTIAISSDDDPFTEDNPADINDSPPPCPPPKCERCKNVTFWRRSGETILFSSSWRCANCKPNTNGWNDYEELTVERWQEKYAAPPVAVSHGVESEQLE